MNKRIVVAGSALSLAVSAIGVSSLSGCKSRMTALDSDLPDSAQGALTGEYVLESVRAKIGNLDEATVRATLNKDEKLKSIFRGKANDINALPIEIVIVCADKPANGSIATVNNLFAFCTLTLWPWVSAQEREYAVTVSSVVNSHQVKFKMLDRNWGGLSPFAVLPVPGWSSERGDEGEINQFHLRQIAMASKVACENLSQDYVEFKKRHEKYLEKISKKRSAVAFAAFQRAKTSAEKTAILDSIVHSSILPKHQVEAIGRMSYDRALIPHWGKISNSRTLAMIYRDGYGALSVSDRKALAAKILDDAVLTEMVTKPSQDG